MQIDILSIFPQMFKSPFDFSIIKRAQVKNKVQIKINDLRSFTYHKHKTVDDKPFGGGPGMVMKVEVVDKAISER